MKKNVKTNLLKHSEAKVRLFGEYLKRYLSVICNDGFTEQINIYDLFCGQGLYENEGEGSPIVALRQVKNTYYNLINNKPVKKPKINCFFNDIDSEKLNILQNAITSNPLHYSTIGELTLTSNDYLNEVDRLTKIFNNYNNEKAFVFIDPYGYKEVKGEHIKQLMNCNKKVEVLLWLPIQFMYRFSKNETPESLKNFIQELGLEDSLNSINSVWDFIELLKNGFQNSLGNGFFVDNFSLKKEENTVFCLFFFTSHIKGFEKMLEAKWDIDTEQGKGWEYSGNQPSLFHTQKTNPLAEKLSEYIKTSNATNGQIYEFTLRQGFLPKHTVEVFKDWVKSGKLAVNLRNGDKARKNSFYIAYNHYKTNEGFSKVTFKINQ